MARVCFGFGFKMIRNIVMMSGDEIVIVDWVVTWSGGDYENELNSTTYSTAKSQMTQGQYSFTETGGVYVSENHGQDDSVAFIEGSVKKPGNISWTVSSETGCDFIHIWKNETLVVTADEINSGDLSVSTNDKISICYSKDVSVDKNDDEATFTFD